MSLPLHLSDNLDYANKDHGGFDIPSKLLDESEIYNHRGGFKLQTLCTKVMCDNQLST